MVPVGYFNNNNNNNNNNKSNNNNNNNNNNLFVPRSFYCNIEILNCALHKLLKFSLKMTSRMYRTVAFRSDDLRTLTGR